MPYTAEVNIKFSIDGIENSKFYLLTIFCKKQTWTYFMPTSRRFRNLKWINFPGEIELHWLSDTRQTENLASDSW